MTAVTHLKNAPIREALIDIRVDRRKDMSVTALAPAVEQLRDRYPEHRLIHRTQLGFRMDADKGAVTEPNVDSSHHGYRLDSEDGKNVIQFQLDGFTFSWLAPYDTWENLYRNARAAWGVYAELADPLRVTRLGVRFINSLALPQPVPQLEQYLTSPPKVPTGLPQAVKSFLSRVVIHDSKIGADCIITQAMEGAEPDSDTLPIVLDIDAIAQRTFAPQEDFWTVISELRELKNSVFFESVTDTTLELYK